MQLVAEPNLGEREKAGLSGVDAYARIAMADEVCDFNFGSAFAEMRGAEHGPSSGRRRRASDAASGPVPVARTEQLPEAYPLVLARLAPPPDEIHFMMTAQPGSISNRLSRYQSPCL
jgi:hypothetical protein